MDQNNLNEGNERMGQFLEIPMPSGAVFPDWSVVSSDNVRESLSATLGVLRMTKKWSDMSADEEQVRRVLLSQYAKSGHAPSYEQLAEATGLRRSEIDDLLQNLEDRDIVVLDRDTRAITGAYPFSERDTGHRIRLGAQMLNAMCAIDALGAGAMCGVDTVIDSTCRQCGRPIRVKTTDNGRRIKTVSPKDAIVWSGVQDIDCCAADSQCTVMAFFCSDDHLASWRGENAEAGAMGHQLTVEEGLQAGMAIFLPFLAGGPGPSTG